MEVAGGLCGSGEGYMKEFGSDVFDDWLGGEITTRWLVEGSDRGKVNIPGFRGVQVRSTGTCLGDGYLDHGGAPGKSETLTGAPNGSVVADGHVLGHAFEKGHVQAVFHDYLVSDTIVDYYMPRGRSFMTEQEKQADLAIQKRINLLKLYVQEQIHLLKLYLVISAASFAAFVIFVLTLAGSNWLSQISPNVGVIVKIVAWPLTVFSAICCIFAGLSGSIGFFRFMLKRPPKAELPPQVYTPPQAEVPPKKTLGTEAGDERGDD